MPAVIIDGHRIIMQTQVSNERTVTPAVLAEAVRQDNFRNRVGIRVPAREKSQAIRRGEVFVVGLQEL